MTGSARRRGRPTLLAPETEVQLLLDAARRVLRRTNFDRLTLEMLLEEAAVSTRAFYRHFASMADLLTALRAEEIDELVRRIEKTAAAAPGPAQALEACVDELLAPGFDPRRVRRARMLHSTAINDLLTRRACLDAIGAALQPILEAGQADGTFPRTDPAADATTVYVIVFDLVERALAGQLDMSYDEAKAHVLRFAVRAVT